MHKKNRDTQHSLVWGEHENKNKLTQHSMVQGLEPSRTSKDSSSQHQPDKSTNYQPSYRVRRKGTKQESRNCFHHRGCSYT